MNTYNDYVFILPNDLSMQRHNRKYASIDRTSGRNHQALHKIAKRGTKSNSF